MSAPSAPANFLGGIIIEVATVLCNYAMLLVVLGAVLYLYRRFRGTESTCLQSVFDRRLITVTVILLLLVGLLQLFV